MSVNEGTVGERRHHLPNKFLKLVEAMAIDARYDAVFDFDVTAFLSGRLHITSQAAHNLQIWPAKGTM